MNPAFGTLEFKRRNGVFEEKSLKLTTEVYYEDYYEAIYDLQMKV